MSKEMNAKVGQIRTFFKKNQPKSHPITDHPISKCEEYVRGLYFDMLCVMAQYENEDIENQLRFVQRIMAACEESMPIAEHSKRAMEITSDKVTEFLKQCKDNKLEEIFFIDSLLISCANGAPNQKQVEFLAEIGDVMGFDKAKMQYLSGLAVSILEQDFEKMKNAVQPCDESTVERSLCYLQPIIDNNIQSSSTKLVLYFPKNIRKPLYKESTTVLENLDSILFDGAYINNAIEFRSVKKVELHNCVFENIKQVCSFRGVENVVIENCIFRNIDADRLFDIAPGCQIDISASRFIKCKVRTCVIRLSSDGCRLDFKECEFQDCSNRVVYYDWSRKFYGVRADGCSFLNCFGDAIFRSSMYNIRAYEGKNNKFVNCACESASA